MRRKSLHWLIVIVFLGILAIRLEHHFRSPHPAGFLLEVGNWVPPEECEFHVPLVLHIAADGSLRLNAEPVTRDHLPERLTMILGERSLPVLYVHADAEITTQESVEILDAIGKYNGNIHIRLVTPGNRKYTCIDLPPVPAG